MVAGYGRQKVKDLSDKDIESLNKSSSQHYRPRSLGNISTTILSKDTAPQLKMVTLPQHDCNIALASMICTFHETKNTCEGDSGAGLMRIRDEASNRLWIFGITSVSGLGVDPATNKLAKCQPNYTLSFHVPVYRHLTWIRKHTRSNLCLEHKHFLIDQDELFDFALILIAFTTCTIILLSLISDQKARFLRFAFSFGNEGKQADHKQPDKETGVVTNSALLPIKVKVSLSFEKITKK